MCRVVRWLAICGALLSGFQDLAPSSAADSQVHWAYRPVVRPVVPTPRERGWCRDPLDRFVLARLERERWTPNEFADRVTLLRRVALTLTGLAPSDELRADFADDHGPDALERATDRLLASPAHGERMAAWWLDLARYADTHGYHADTHRDMWRWRDWVIEAFNRGQPFDQFTIEQLAGDLLPNATFAQRLATGFNRNHMVMAENGVIEEEYRTEYVADRVVTVGAVWLGQTLQCARCHDHKHDPFTMRDFYRLFAFFNQVDERGVDGAQGNAVPVLVAPTELQQQEFAQRTQRIAELRRAIERRLVDADPRQEAWERRRATPTTARLPDDVTWHLPLDEPRDPPSSRGTAANSTIKFHGQPTWAQGRQATALVCDGETWIDVGDIADLERTDAASFGLWLFPTTDDDAVLLARAMSEAPGRGNRLYVEDRKIVWRLAADASGNEIAVRSRSLLARRKWQHVTITYDGSGRAAGVKIYLDGRLTEIEVLADRLTLSPRVAESLTVASHAGREPFRGLLDDLRYYRRVVSSDEAAMLGGLDPIAELLAIPAARRTAQQQRALRQSFLAENDAHFEQQQRTLKGLERDLLEFEKALPTAMVMSERTTPRTTHILTRGQYDAPGAVVVSGTPDCLPPLKPSSSSAPTLTSLSAPISPTASSASATRFELAQWLVRPDHPLTARVTANRIWQLHFGIGLVGSADDFGTRGERPSHPELLDWLASELMSGRPALAWDLKRFQRCLVTSSAFRQSSRATRQQRASDPDNRLVARGPQWRLPAEVVRDLTLDASGLLDRRVGGPSVFPYQPPGLWEELAYDAQLFTAQTYRQSHGRDLYRRSVYTFWKRAVTPPPLAAFDAPDREVCTITRPVTTGPLQALVLMNETGRVEAARALACRARREVGSEPSKLGRRMFELGTSRLPDDQRLGVLLELFHDQRAAFRETPAEAQRLLTVGELPTVADWSSVDQAAWTTVGQVILSLDPVLYLP